MRWFLHKTVTLQLDQKADGSFGSTVNGEVLEVDGTGVTIQNGAVTYYYQWTRVANMFV